MPRIHRGDEPGAWFHVVNRGIARRPLFESTRDRRFFLAQLAAAARKGVLEVHAFSLMATHFHLLVRSPVARLSDAMQRIEVRYSRWFNRSRRRDGPLYRGRFRSSLIRTMAYRAAVLAYIDRNPVEAHIVSAPSLYPHGSAALHVRPRGPRWLTRDVVAGIVADRGGRVGAGAENYDAAVLGCASADIGEVVDRRLREVVCEAADEDWPSDPLDDLVTAAPARVQAWMREKAHLADGTDPGIAVLTASTVLRLVGEGGFVSGAPRSQSMRAGLLRTVCGLRYREIAERTGCAESSAHRRVLSHVRALREDPVYCAIAAKIVAAGLRMDFPAPSRARIAPSLPHGPIA